jgi:hypothetical protein
MPPSDISSDQTIQKLMERLNRLEKNKNQDDKVRYLDDKTLFD